MSTTPTTVSAADRFAIAVWNALPYDHEHNHPFCPSAADARLAVGLALTRTGLKLAPAVADAAPTDLHQQIMNLPADPTKIEAAIKTGETPSVIYKYGHRDARHAAAELACAAAAPTGDAIAEAVRVLEEWPKGKRTAVSTIDRALALLTGRSAKAEGTGR
jgi:hypothetical protein